MGATSVILQTLLNSPLCLGDLSIECAQLCFVSTHSVFETLVADSHNAFSHTPANEISTWKADTSARRSQGEAVLGTLV